MAIYVDYSRPSTNCRWIMSCLPVLAVALSSLAFSVPYFIKAKASEIKTHRIPFLSEIGESSLFTLGLCLSANFNLVILIIRFYQIKGISHKTVKINHVSLLIGCVFVLGKLVTASYHLSKNAVIHYTGYGVYFIGVLLYIITQVYITRNYVPQTNSCVAFLRTACCIIMLTCIVGFIVMMLPFVAEFNRQNDFIAPICEWSVVFTKSLFILTFAYDFWKIGMSVEVKRVNIEHDRFSSVSKRELRGRYSVNSNKSSNKTEDYDSVYFDNLLPNIPPNTPNTF